ncbi:hypothetical protein Tco_1271485, partial [Tanacetum coccineum]
PENKAHYESEKEVIHLILTGIGDEIYSTVNACQTAQEMWEAIERLQQGESLNIQDLILHRSSINNSARLSNKFGGFYFIFKFGISGLLHQVITTIADRIRGWKVSQRV